MTKSTINQSELPLLWPEIPQMLGRLLDCPNDQSHVLSTPLMRELYVGIPGNLASMARTPNGKSYEKICSHCSAFPGRSTCKATKSNWTLECPNLARHMPASVNAILGL
ncbi:uncharacterized protein RSE6_04415 [Rhynchosporium secalis]|uniref:Uncharacterized protein n=1 Tax=Rhynchosporium secalis TaxID=38038 RepID=A0A1E1M5A4_RHYSE|nr:uncharacterized protein RSE6_04415 [Rhynchosporium secalis]